MKNLIVFLLSVLPGLFVPAAHAGNDAAAGAAAQAVPRRGTLYRIRHHDSTVYLFGTIHVGRPDFFPLEPEVMRALARAGTLLVEIDVRDGTPFQQALQRHGLYPDGDTIARHLSDAGLAQLRRALRRFDLPFEQVARMKPWLVANLLLGLNLERNGYRRAQGTEFFLLAQAERQKKTVRELESADYQMALFDGMAESEQEQYLIENLVDLDDGAASRNDAALVDAWAHANGDAVEGLMRASLVGKPASAAFTHRVLLDKRNPEMANKIAALLDQDGTAFVAVGLLHLVGDNGVPGLLRQKGYAVEKLY